MVGYLSATYDIAPEEIATIGDMPNDVRMFAQSGLSIAMGNASDEVKRAARPITTTDEDEGFARRGAVHPALTQRRPPNQHSEKYGGTPASRRSRRA